MIFNVIDYHLLFKLSRLIDLGEFKGIEFTTETFFHYLMDRFDTDKIKVFVSIENKEINGFVICSLSQDVVTERPEVFIDLAWTKKGTNGNVGERLLKKTEEYTRGLNLSRISGFTLRGQERGMFKKYGFRPYSTIMVKDLMQVSNQPQNSQKAVETRPQGDNNAFKEIASHKQICKAYYAQNKESILQKRKRDYKLKKMKKSQNNEKTEVRANAK